jgi:hypothetical protein
MKRPPDPARAGPTMKTIGRSRASSQAAVLHERTAPRDPDAFTIEFLLQAAARIDWSALAPWIHAVEAGLHAHLPLCIYKLHLLAAWFELDGRALEQACRSRAVLRRFIGAPLHGPVVDALLYLEHAPKLARVRPALAKLVAAVELQLVDQGLFPPAQVLGSLASMHPGGAATAATLVSSQALRVVDRSATAVALDAARAGGEAEPPAAARRALALLVWPWGETTPIQRRILIGRDPGCGELARHLHADLKVSRLHAMLTPVADGILLRDIGSSNGTYVDARALPYAGARMLHEDAELRFGGDLTVQLAFART